MDKFSELKAAAMAATPGPWSWKVDGIFYYLSPEGVNTPLERIIDDGSSWGEYAETIEHDGPDARFIAAANPAAVLELLAELEAKDEVLREVAFRVSAGGYNADSVDAEVFKQKIIDGIDSISGVLIKRIDELEGVKADASQVFKEIGNELGCNPDNESIMMAIDALKERLATPVRLPTKYSLKLAGDKSTRAMFSGHNSAINDSADAIRAAGFKVEGDEQ